LLPFSSESFFFFLFTTKEQKIKTYRTLIVPCTLHESETWSFTFTEEHWLGKFEGRHLTKDLMFDFWERREIFPVSTATILALGLMQTLIQCIQGTSSTQTKLPRHESDHSLPFSDKV
jgi:hypothetical protein